MAALYLESFDASSPAQFRADLNGKDEAILLFHEGSIVGFTTFQVFKHVWRGQQVRIVYSGDTVVIPEHWGQQQLAFSWIRRMGQLKMMAPATPMFWFLVVKGHRTFKYLSVFAKSFFPHWAIDRSDLKPLGDQLATDRFGDHYNLRSGVVEFERSRGHLKAFLASAASQELTKPATQFFFCRNPGYRQGHELVCICELELFNMRPLAARIFHRAPKELVLL